MKTLISSVLLFCILAAALWPVPKAEGATKPKCPSLFSSGCPSTQDFVCGTDGNSYMNECVMCKMNKNNGGKVKVVKKGYC
uniref:Proteinase inhibitor n=1 Tax=Cruziohyla calcarifer TaxID=318249 RepID=A0A1W2KE30_CRUCA|nr:proteinase inhibitor precursor [Cruziohyla calcarifer]